MDSEFNLQDVVRCHLCEDPVPPLHCAFCRMHLCFTCKNEHLSHKSEEHQIVPFNERGRLYPKCSKHPTNLCDLYCKQCDVPFCFECVSSGKHLEHTQVNILNVLKQKKKIIQRDLKEFENSIYPKYKEIAFNILVQKDGLNENAMKLTIAINKHGEALHREIDIAIKKLQSDVDKMKYKCMVDLQKLEDEINNSISEITQTSAKLTQLLNSNEVFSYKPRSTEFQTIPPKIVVSLPKFIPPTINRKQIHRQIGSLSASSTFFITEINTAYGKTNTLYSVACQNDQEVWTRGLDSMIRLYNIHSKLVKSIQTKSGNTPSDVAVTQDGELVYTDYEDKTVNIVKNTQIQKIIKLGSWRPCNLCSTSSGGLLVAIVSDDQKRSKVVRYSGSTKKQTIQFDDQGQPFYSSNASPKYICENKNLDICVADNEAGAVVVVNQAGELQFIYTGLPSKTEKPFFPFGIATDSQSRVLTADCDNHRIHILDQIGNFLRYIDNSHLVMPCGLCVDTKDNLFVAETSQGKVMKIQC